MKIDIYKIDGQTSGEKIELADDIFGIEPNEHAIYLAVKAYLANQRQGTHKTKERSEVRGGGRKPWRQKGRGAARAGTTRSPIWIGGGRTFGPRVRDYTQKLPKKVKQLARKSALSSKAKEKQLLIVEDFTFEQPKTKEFATVLDALDLNGKKILLLTGKTDENVYKSGRNIPRVSVMEASKASTYNILNSQLLVLQKSAVMELVKPFRNKTEVVN
jgi:large subunit ribosomal protein L4